MENRAPFRNDLSLPLIAAPIFLISGPKLVVETCKNGVVGTFPALNQRSTDGFDQWLTETEESLEAHRKENGKPVAPYG